MSFYKMNYSMTDPGTPGWQFAPVPGWGMNPAAAGPRRVGVGCNCATPMGQDDTRTATDIEGRYKQTSYGMVAAAGAGALLVGVFLGYVAGKRAQRKVTANRRRQLTRNAGKKSAWDDKWKWRKEKGAKHYLFEWKGGGYNDVWARSPGEAKKRAKLLETGKLKADTGTVQPYTREREQTYEAWWVHNNPRRKRPSRSRAA